MEVYGQTVKSVIRSGLAHAYYLSQVHRFCHWGRIMILTYHRILPSEELHHQYVQPGMYVRDDVFEQHVLFLMEHFQVLSLHELLRLWQGDTWDERKRYCVITFDDGWLDNYRYAYPILKKYKIPATIFLPTDYIGTREWFWPEKISYLVNEAWDSGTSSSNRAQVWAVLCEYLRNNPWNRSDPNGAPSDQRGRIHDEIIEQCKGLPAHSILKLVDNLSSVLNVKVPDERLLVDWGEVGEMSQDNISFGSHSCSHRILTMLSMPDVKAELEISFRVLTEKQVNHVPVFCYPNGNTNDEIQKMVIDSGYQAGVGVGKGSEGRHPGNLYDLNRFSMHNDIASTRALLVFHLFGPLS